MKKAILLLPFIAAAFAEPEGVIQSLRNSVEMIDQTGTPFRMTPQSDGFLQALPETNAKDWYREVKIVDYERNDLTGQTYKISTKYYNKAVSNPLVADLPVMNKEGKTITATAGRIVVDSVNKNKRWPHYNVFFVNSKGETVTPTGEIVKDKEELETYKASKAKVDDLLLQGKIHEIANFFVDLDENDNLIPPCNSSQEQIQEHMTPKVETQPARKIASNDLLKDRQNTESYDAIMDKRSSMKGVKGCESKRRKFEKELPNAMWSNLNIDQRAQRIYDHAKRTFDSIKNHEKTEIGSENKTNFSQRANPHYIHPAMSPELISCISYKETHGALRPQMHNYTWCGKQKNPLSSAHGLGMITGTTLRLMTKYKPNKKVVNQVPITTIPGDPYKGKGWKELHKSMADDVPLTMELLFRVLNDNLKQQNFALRKKQGFNPDSAADTLKHGVALYDQDRKSKYLESVLKKCLPCMKKVSKGKKTPIQCHNEMK